METTTTETERQPLRVFDAQNQQNNTTAQNTGGVFHYTYEKSDQKRAGLQILKSPIHLWGLENSSRTPGFAVGGISE